ncbi:male sterility protein-domain-containing protein [Xylariaceae sp. FL0255]|nr:male sterility protein-domain-containing protein [Xylariaceae sp. FL0255]
MPELIRVPDYGRRLVPNIIDAVALNDPNRAFASIPRSENLEDGYTDISYQTVANAINRMCWWLSENLGLADTSEVFSYGMIGPNDIRYPIFLVAAMKCGYKMMLPSPRNSKQYQIELLHRTGCKTVLCARSHVMHFNDLHEDLDIFLAIVPSVSEILSERPETSFPFTRSFNEIRHDEFMILHTSGSTGPPKPISFSIESTTTEDAHQSLEDPSQRLWWRLFANCRYFLGMPCFHSAGIWFALFLPVYFGSIVVYGPSTRPLTSDIAATGMIKGEISGGIYPPSILEGLSKSSDYLERVSTLDFVAYGGGALDKAAGDRLSRITVLHNFIGFTEASAPPRFVMKPEDWNYFEFHPASGFVARHHHNDLYGITFERQEEHELVQSCFKIFPDLKEYSPGDLISRHPTKQNLWTHRGRIDDLVVLSNGEKFNPTPVEEILRQCRYVKDAIIVGEGRFQASALIERDMEIDSSISDTELIEILWPFVERSNEQSSAHAKVIKSLVFVAPFEKPFSRSAKGTLQRKSTIQNFEVELSDLYSGTSLQTQSKQAVKRSLSINIDTETKLKPVSRDQNLSGKPNRALKEEVVNTNMKEETSLSIQAIRELVNSVCGKKLTSDTGDLFEVGVDSLQASAIVGQLRDISEAWPADQSEGMKLLYSNPSIQGIFMLLQSHYDDSHSSDLTPTHTATSSSEMTCESSTPSAATAINTMIEKYTVSMRELSPTNGKTIVLTGGTGSLGCHLLQKLLRDPLVSRIICLHRRADGLQRQKQEFAKRGINVDLESKRVDFFQIDFSRSDLDLRPSELHDLLTAVDLIIHNAWNVDFNQNLTSFETHIAGVRHLADLATRSRAQLIFVSSVASVIQWDQSLGAVPERVIHDQSVAGDSGYSQSKHVAERILQKAAASSDLQVSIVRVGQIAGPARNPGGWNAADWLPMLVSTSKALGALPKSLGTADNVDWVPIDVVAEVFVDLMRHVLSNRSRSTCQVFHIANPQATPWAALLPATHHALGNNTELVPFDEWVRRLKAKGRLEHDVLRFPALKILPFYETLVASPDTRMVVLETNETLAVSPSLYNLGEIQGAWMERWIPAWNT